MDKIIDNLIKLKDYVPFFQTVLWISLIISLILIFRKYVYLILNTTVDRIKHGSSFKAGPIEVGEKLEQLDYIAQNEKLNGLIDSDREAHRVGIYKNNNGLFITHLIYPSDKSGVAWDIFIYLIRHKSSDFSDIKKAEFFFGHMWGNQIYEEKEKNGIIGVKTSAYAPFLCTCFVTMKDDSVIKLDRYIDFEMERIIKK
jgi:hypothetical protein